MFNFNFLYMKKRAKVKRVTDGKIIEVTNRTLRLADVDVPKIDETGGKKAKNVLNGLIFSNNSDGWIVFEDKGSEISGKLIVTVYVRNRRTSEIKCINEIMREKGYIPDRNK